MHSNDFSMQRYPGVDLQNIRSRKIDYRIIYNIQTSTIASHLLLLTHNNYEQDFTNKAFISKGTLA
jgi:hypothetical protein